jgi:hypothetical protein
MTSSISISKLKNKKKFVGQYVISEPQLIRYKDSTDFILGNLIFCDSFSIIYNDKEKNDIFLHKNDDCEYLTVKSGTWNCYHHCDKPKKSGWEDNYFVMINAAIDIEGFLFHDKIRKDVCGDACSVQLLDVSLSTLTHDMITEIMEIHNNHRGYYSFYKTYPIIHTGGDTGIQMECYTYNNEICAIAIL